MPLDEESLGYEIIAWRIISSTKVSDRVERIVASLSQDAQVDEKAKLLYLTAHAKATTKLITVVEIAKRQLVLVGARCYQYTALSSQIVEIPRQKQTVDRTIKGDAHEVTSDPEDAAFEVMGQPGGDTKQRNVPIMKIYLSQKPVKELRAEYGEQRVT
ncbi:hypothetical protein LTR78_008279 [Recurvomyces mirabilis]|uniref:DNA/RNA-binding protein Alba-like domain-containing protein n=1 Tax=Recurvomyces mirabilis TaxID=574656 RepID=A0AAE0TTG5_9PEZI|nr:hypothetical protein LTR78_008279 [Recurvomyces mirabilis]KAK5156564.1 hypothetical protein LTS14_004776 [Recurvomyces mirabilis]